MIRLLSIAGNVPTPTIAHAPQSSMTSLGSELIRNVKVYGRKTGEDFPAWNQEFEVVVQTVPNLKELAKLNDVDGITTLINEFG